MSGPCRSTLPRLCRKTRSGFPSGLSLGVEDERPFFRLAASGSIDDETNIACFAVFARRKNCSLSGRRASFPTKPGARNLMVIYYTERLLPKYPEFSGVGRKAVIALIGILLRLDVHQIE